MATNVTGSSADILSRFQRVFPFYWAKTASTYFNAVVGGIADSVSWAYSLITYAQKQARLATASGPFLDIISYDFLGRFLLRKGRNDSVFRSLIKATVLQERVTRAGMVNALTALLGKAPTIFEPWNTGDTGSYGGYSLGYGVAGGWGNMDLPGQVFIQVGSGPGFGIPGISGYGGYAGGYGAGSSEYDGSELAQNGITNDDIYNLIAKVKPTGVIAWTNIGQST